MFVLTYKKNNTNLSYTDIYIWQITQFHIIQILQYNQKNTDNSILIFKMGKSISQSQYTLESLQRM